MTPSQTVHFKFHMPSHSNAEQFENKISLKEGIKILKVLVEIETVNKYV